METVANESGRDAAGRFVAGQSGNPAGKKPGTKNRKTLMLEALRDGEGVAAARVVIDKAVAGDAVAARFVVTLISPKPRGRTIYLEMPEDDDCNVVTAFNVTLRALCNGEITPDEALQVSRFLEGRHKTLRAWQLEENLTSHGRTIPGDPEWAPDDDDDDDDDDEENEEDEAAALGDDAPMASAEGPVPLAAPAAAASAAAPPEAPFGASALQSACIFQAPGTIRDVLSIPLNGSATAAGVARCSASSAGEGGLWRSGAGVSTC